MSAVLCLPACLCVSAAASRGQAPHGNASKAFHRRGATHPSRATRGHLNPEHHGLRSAARQQRRVREGGVATGTPTSASSFGRPAPAALPATSTASTATPEDRSIEGNDGELAGGGQDVAAAPPPCGAPTAWVGVGAALPPQQPPVRRRHARELRAPRGHGRQPPAGSGRLAAGGGICPSLPPEALEGWTRPDRPGEGLRPDRIEEYENPDEYPLGATINVSMWDMIEKKLQEPGNERTLQGSSSSVSPGKEKRSAGDKKRDKKWREYQESLDAGAAEAAKGGTPAPSPQRASGGHHPGHTNLGDFLEVAKKAKTKPRQLHLRQSGPSSDVESAHRERMPADQASSSSSVAPDQRDVAAPASAPVGCPATFGLPGNGPRSRTLPWRAPSASPRRRPEIGVEAWPSTPRPWRPLRPDSRPQLPRRQRRPGSGVRWRQPPRKPAWPRRPLSAWRPR